MVQQPTEKSGYNNQIVVENRFTKMVDFIVIIKMDITEQPMTLWQIFIFEDSMDCHRAQPQTENLSCSRDSEQHSPNYLH